MRGVAQAASNSNSLLAKLIRGQTIALAVLIACVCATLYVGLVNASNGVDDQTMEKRFLTVRGLLNTEAEREEWLGHEVSEDMEGPRRVFIRVLLDDASLLQETPDMGAVLPAASFAALRPDQQTLRMSLSAGDGRRYRTLVARAPVVIDGAARSGVVQIAIDTTLDQAVLRRFASLMLLVAGAALLAGALASAYQFSLLLAPLNRMADEIKHIDHHNLDKRVSAEGLTDELKHLGGQFNGLLERLQIAYQGLKHYADNVAHEIRSPLNKMLLGLSVAQQKERTAAQYEEFLCQLGDNCRDLNALVERLLFLARASSGQASIMRQLVDVQAEVEAVREYFEASAAEAGVRLEVDPGHSVAVSADRTLLQRAITNLVANAISHTPAGGVVRLSARQDENVARIQVSDTGSGIAAEDQPHIFDRFYRADKQRVAGVNRVGLGLPITKSIVELHGGEIHLDSELGKGTSATITLPLGPGQAATAA